MDIVLCIYDRYDGEEDEYITWEWYQPLHHEHGAPSYWVKKSKPNLSHRQIKEQLDWHIASNREDLIFLAKEKKLFDEWYNKELKEIKDADKENIKIKNNLSDL